MKFKCEIDINAPINEVVELFDDPENYKHWQDGFQSYKVISGERGLVGTKAEIVLQQGKRKIELLETIIVNNLPYELSATYVHSHMENTMRNKFKALNSVQTLYTAEVEYTKFNGLMPKLMAISISRNVQKTGAKMAGSVQRICRSKVA